MEKSILKSKTIIGLILASLTMWAPTVGIDFTQEDAGFIMENLDKVIASGFAAFAFYGRFVAQAKLRWK